MYDLTNLSESDATQCGEALAQAASGASNMEEVANKIVGHLYDNLVDSETGAKSCALVRLYKTHAYGELDPELRGFAQGILGHAPESEDMKCLTLLGTAGEKPEWNDRSKSEGHKAIPLPSEGFVSQIPMISRLVSQFALDVNAVIWGIHLTQVTPTSCGWAHGASASQSATIDRALGPRRPCCTRR